MTEITPPESNPLPKARGVFCNRTLNFRALRAIGYDMDYTLVDYRAEAFERRVYDMAKEAWLSLIPHLIPSDLAK